MTVLRGRNRKPLRERTGEMGQVAEATVMADVGYRTFGVLQEFGRALQTGLDQPLSWRRVEEKNSNSMVLLLDGLKGCQMIRHASCQVPQPTKQTIPQSIVLIWNKVASGWK